MGDILRFNKDKRHRSSSSITTPNLDSTCSERKLDIKASIPEADDQFLLAETRCQELQDKIDYVKSLKRKKKLKKRSMTRFPEVTTPEAVPLISVRTQLKKTAGAPALPKRVPPRPLRRYVDQATIEQHQMLGQVRGYNKGYKQPSQEQIPASYQDMGSTQRKKTLSRHALADGDRPEAPQRLLQNIVGDTEAHYETRKPVPTKRQLNERVNLPKRNIAGIPEDRPSKNPISLHQQRPRNAPREQTSNEGLQEGERPVVELLYKNRPVNPTQLASREKINSDDHCEEERKSVKYDDDNIMKERPRYPRLVKYRSRRYELPTVASQMKQAGVRYYSSNTNCTIIPFIISKSTEPSHNIAVNIQQVDIKIVERTGTKIGIVSKPRKERATAAFIEGDRCYQ